MLVTLRNDFHGTAVKVRVPESGILSPRQYRRACRVLCGISDCQCGSIRGPQDTAVEPWQDSRTGEYSCRIAPR